MLREKRPFPSATDLSFRQPSPFVIPSEGEESAVRHSGAPNLEFYNHFSFVIPSVARDLRFPFFSLLVGDYWFPPEFL